MSNHTPPAESVDARGERCPDAAADGQACAERVPSGAVLEVLSTDAGSERDFESFARLAGHIGWIVNGRDDDVLCLTITKA